MKRLGVLILRFFVSAFIVYILIVIHAIAMTLIKHEDFIGTYYSVNIKPDITLKVCGTARSIIDQKEDKVFVNDVDSMTVVEDAVYGKCNNKYFLLTISDKKVVYSSTPMLQYSTYELVSPLEYYQTKTRLIDIIGHLILLTCIIITIKIGILTFLKGLRCRFSNDPR